MPECMICFSPGGLIYSGLHDYLFGIKGRWSLYRCGKCGLYWIAPAPSAAEYNNLYDNYYTHEEIKNTWFVRAVTRLIPAVTLGYGDSLKTLSSRILGKLLSFVGPLREAGYSSLLWLSAEKRGKILDVGCGSGIFLSHMKHFGWDVHGFEPDEKAAVVARKKLQLDSVHSGSFSDAGHKENSFDVVTLSHVIEHLPEPADVLDLCRRVLKPGGLLIIATPNPDSLGRRIFKKDWRGWEPPRHIHIFSSASLVRMVQYAGFTAKALKTPSSASYYNCVNSLLIKKLAKSRDGKVKKPSLMMKIAGIFFWGLEYILTRAGLYWGEESVIFAERKN